MSNELAIHLSEVSKQINRQIGVYVNRRGIVEKVFIGEHSSIFLPDTGRARAASNRLRGVRLIHTHLKNESITQDDLMDLALIRLDMVAAVTVSDEGKPSNIYYSHLIADNKHKELWDIIGPVPLYKLDIDCLFLIESLENEFARNYKLVAPVPGRERAILIGIINQNTESFFEKSIEELKELCRTSDVDIADIAFQKRKKPDPKYLIGKGKIQEIILNSLRKSVDLLIFDTDLTPAQVKSITNFTELRVIDRTQLILDIFARHARSKDGKVQVELAQLKYTLPRLIEKNTAMSRLTGGIGSRGPGETKLEINRRRVRERIGKLELQIKNLSNQRTTRRQQRKRTNIPIISIVGYTNVGKSTLLNHLTKSNVLAENKLFATLDTTTRRLRFPKERNVIITDTVGFIRNLPKDLLNAFKATLEELEDADLLLHIVDSSDHDIDNQIKSVNNLLDELGLARIPKMLVFNKIDLLNQDNNPHDFSRLYNAIPISASKQKGLKQLLIKIENKLWEDTDIFC